MVQINETDLMYTPLYLHMRPSKPQMMYDYKPSMVSIVLAHQGSRMYRDPLHCIVNIQINNIYLRLQDA